MNNYNKTSTSSLFICAHHNALLQIIMYYNVFSYLYKTICSEKWNLKNIYFIISYSETESTYKFLSITQWVSQSQFKLLQLNSS